MALGIIEPRSADDDVPGTIRYFTDPELGSQQNDSREHLKFDESGPDVIILNPQPTDDPNDPLNWPLWKRDLTICVLSCSGIFAACLGSILASNTLALSLHFQVSISGAAVLTGYYLVGAGAAAVFFVPSARVWGKRHLFLIGVILVMVSCAWAGGAGHNYHSLIAARAFQGVGTAPFESLLNAAVGDLYCVHQRGFRMAITNLAVFGSAFFTPIVAGKITESLGWEWSFYFVAIFTACTLPAVFLLCPETAFRRDTSLGFGGSTEQMSEPGKSPLETSSHGSSDMGAASEPAKGFVLVPTSSAMQPIGNANTTKKTLVQSLSLFDGRKTDERYWVLLLRPFPLLLNPAFVWGCLIQGVIIGWSIFTGVLIGVIFVGPPFFWGEVKAGYTYTSAFVGALAGFALSGAIADTSANWLTKANKGVYEPEFRLVLAIPMLITACIGLFGFGLTIEDVPTGKVHWIVPLVFFAFIVAAMVIGAVVSSLYIADAYRDITVEGFTLMIIFKNMFGFVLTWYAYDWLVQSGWRRVLVSVAGCQTGICLLSIPMYIWGKCVRSFFQRHDLLRMTGLD